MRSNDIFFVSTFHIIRAGDTHTNRGGGGVIMTVGGEGEGGQAMKMTQKYLEGEGG